MTILNGRLPSELRQKEPKVIRSPRGHLAMSAGKQFGCQGLGKGVLRPSSGCYLSYKAQDGPPISKLAPIVHSADQGRETLIQKPRAGVLAQVAVTKYHRPSDLNNSNFFSHISGGRKSKTRMLTGLVSLFGLQMASHLALFSHGQSSGHVHPWCLS